MDKPEPIFADGIMFTRPPEGSPTWIKGKVSINVSKFNDFLKSQIPNVSAKGWLNLDLKESKKGSLYFQVNTWKSPETKNVEELKKDISNITSKGHGGEVINGDDIPFD